MSDLMPAVASFAVTWFWYVMAFLAGMFVAWLLARWFVPSRTPQEGIDAALDRRRHDAGDEDAERHGEDEDDDRTIEIHDYTPAEARR